MNRKKSMITIEAAAQLLRAGDDYFLYTHRKPDGDTIGSAAALCLALRALGKTAYLAPNSEFTPRYAFLTAPLLPPADYTPACNVVCDTASAKQLSIEGAALYAADKNAFFLAVDHHVSNTGFVENTLLDHHCAACGEVVYALLDALGVALTEDIAKAIYVAVATDTGCFRYANTTANTLAVAADVARLPIAQSEINYLLFIEKSRARLALERILFQTMRFHADGRVCTAILTEQMRKESGATEDDIESLSALPRQIRGVDCGILLRQEGAQLRVSVRSSDRLDASALCTSLGGGGHPRAAGVTLTGLSTEQAEALIVEKAAALL